jgi:hypothetical protein
MVTSAVELIESLRQTPNQLGRSEEEQIKRETLKRLGDLDPILQHIMDVKLVRNERRNFINVRIKADYTTLLFQHCEHGVFNCFFLSDKLEPFVTITVVTLLSILLPFYTFCDTLNNVEPDTPLAIWRNIHLAYFA